MNINELIETYNEYILKLPSGVMLMAEYLRDEKISLALNSIKDFSEGVLWISKVTKYLKMNNVNIKLDLNSVDNFLTEINEALEKQDYLLVADIFEYEIVPFFEALELIKVEN